MGNVLLPHRREERQTDVDGVQRPRGNDEELGRSRHLGPPENRCGDETLPRVRVRHGEPCRKRDADGAHGDVDRALAQARDHALLAEDDAFDSAVVRQHRKDGVAPAGVRHFRGGPRTLLDQSLRLAGRAIVDCDLMAGPEQARHHPDPHLPEPNESDLHDLTSLQPESVAVIVGGGTPPGPVSRPWSASAPGPG